MSNLLVALYRDFSRSQETLYHLLAENIFPNNIGLITGEPRAVNMSLDLERLLPTETLTVLSICHVKVMGAMLTSLTTTMVGGNPANFVEALSKWNVPCDAAQVYAEGLRCGATLLAVWATFNQTLTIQSIMMRDFSELSCQVCIYDRAAPV